MSEALMAKLFGGEATGTPAPATTEPANQPTSPEPETAEAEVTATGTEPAGEGAPPEKADEKSPEPGGAQDPDAEIEALLSTMSKDDRGKMKALLGERSRRQAAEQASKSSDRKVAELEQTVAELKAKISQPPAAPQPDPETPIEYYQNPIKFQDERARQIFQEEQQRIQAKADEDRYRAAAAVAREKHANFDELERAFQSHIDEPGVFKAWRAAEDPAEFVVHYETVVRPTLLGEKPAAAPVVDEETLRAKIRAELEQEHKDQRAAAAAKGAVPTQAGATGSGAKPGRSGRASTQQLLGRMFNQP